MDSGSKSLNNDLTMKKLSSQAFLILSLFILSIAILAAGAYWWLSGVQHSDQDWDSEYRALPNIGKLEQRIDKRLYGKQAQVDRQIGADIEQIVDQQAMQAKLSGLTRNITLLRDPTQAELRAFFKLHQEEYREISLFSFKQLLFPTTKFGGQAVSEAKKILDKMTADPNSLQGYAEEPLHLSSLQLDKLYGQGYSNKLLSLVSGNQAHALPCWSNPITSKVGAHLICFASATPGAIPKLQSIRSLVINDWRYETAKQQSSD